MSPDVHPNTFIIAGMHRSGTSMTASFLQALGLDVGRRLNPADANNRRGYFEDLDFMALHRAMFASACETRAAGWAEVGWTEAETLDEARLAAFTPQARAVIAERAGLRLWGWKDPRTTMLLPFWDALLPQARYVLVYRRPWDVVDSLFRAGHAALAERPDFALRIWLAYNRRLLAFHQARPDRCVLVSTDALADRLPEFARLLEDKLGLPIADADPAATLRGLLDPTLLRRMPPSHPLIALYRSRHPEAMAMLEALDAAADIPGPSVAHAPTDTAAIAALHHASIDPSPGRRAEEALRHAGAQASRLASLEQALQAAEQDRERLRPELASALQALAETQQVLAAAQQALAETRQALGDRDAELAAMRASTSWRLTGPLRAVLTTWRARP